MSLNPAQIYLTYLRVTSYTIAPLCENKGDLNQDQSRAGLGGGLALTPCRSSWIAPDRKTPASPLQQEGVFHFTTPAWGRKGFPPQQWPS